MRELIHEAGWPIYLVLAFSAVTLVAAVRYAAQPQRSVRLLIAAGAATLSAGLMGFLLGFIHCLDGLRQVEDPALQQAIFFQGLRESILNLATASVIATVATLLALVAAWRMRTRGGGVGGVVPAAP
jgi:hypothetical protein